LVERFTGLPIAVSVGRLVFVLLGAIAMCMVSGTIVTRRLSRAEPAKLF
jgi:ABC-type lipoprotein release transport system permease subunit